MTVHHARDPRPPARRERLASDGGRVLLLLGALLALVVLPGAAQERSPAETIRSDRPGLGDGAWVLGPGVWQAELGGGLESSGPDEFLAGTALFRLGLDDLEIRVALPPLTLARSDEDVALGDLVAGIKLPLTAQEGWLVSLRGDLSLPTSTVDDASDQVGSSLAILAETPLSDEVALTLNAGYGFLFDEVGDGTLTLVATPSVTLSEGVSAYAGYAGFYREGDDAHFVEGGVAWSPRADIQWDLNAGLDPDSERWFLGAGFATRW